MRARTEAAQDVGLVWPGPPWGGERLSALRLAVAALANPLLQFEQRMFEEPVFTVSTPIGKRIVVSDPVLVEHVLATSAANYRRDRIQRRIVRRTTGYGVFSAEGDEWRALRRLLSPFFTPKAIEALLPQMAAAVGKNRQSLHATRQQPLDVLAAMSELAVTILLEALFPKACAIVDASEAAASVRRFGALNGRVRPENLLGLPDWLRSWTSRKLRAERLVVDRRAEQILSVEGNGDPGQSIAAALAQRRVSGQDKRVARDTVPTLLGAGSETTGATLAWTLILLASAPKALELARKEAEAIHAQGMTAGALRQGVWLQAVIDEAMRLLPPAPMLGREALGPDRLGDMAIRRGDVVVIAPWVLHRHRTLWVAADEYRPERFLPDARSAIPRYAYIPFGAGPRICPGAGFARQEMALALAHILANHSIEPVDKATVALLQRITLQPRDGFRMRFADRYPEGR